MRAELDWREQAGVRFLRADYTALTSTGQRIELMREAAHQLELAEPGQRMLALIEGTTPDDITGLAKAALEVHRTVYLPRRTLISMVGLPRAASAILRTFNALGARGRMTSFPDETQALDWLLSH